MKRVTIKNLAGQETHGALIEDPTDWIASCVASNSWGLPERWTLHKDEFLAQPYDEADVIGEETRIVQPALEAVLDEAGVEVFPAQPEVSQKFVKLRSTYTIEITELGIEYQKEIIRNKRKAEYPDPTDFLDAYFDGNQEALAELQAKRLEVKAKYPFPVA